MAKDPKLSGMSIDEVFEYSPIRKQMVEVGYTEDELRPILQDYEGLRSDFINLANKYTQEISAFNRVHSITSRVKTVGSFCEKILRKNDSRRARISLQNYRTEIRDLIGIRALYVFPDEFAVVYDQIYEKYSNIFDGYPEVRYRKGDNLEVFKKRFAESRVTYADSDGDYRSIHYLLHHNDPDVRIELQTRTVFEEGWSEINHRTVYDMGEVPNATLLRIVSSILSRMVGTCNDIGSLIYSIAYNQEVEQKIDSLQIDEIAVGSLTDDLKKFIDTL